MTCIQNAFINIHISQQIFRILYVLESHFLLLILEEIFQIKKQISNSM